MYSTTQHQCVRDVTGWGEYVCVVLIKLPLCCNETPDISSLHSHLLPFSLLAPTSPGHPSMTRSICPAHPPLLSASSADPAAPPPATGQVHQHTVHMHRNRTHQIVGKTILTNTTMKNIEIVLYKNNWNAFCTTCCMAREGNILQLTMWFSTV